MSIKNIIIEIGDGKFLSIPADSQYTAQISTTELNQLRESHDEMLGLLKFIHSQVPMSTTEHDIISAAIQRGDDL